MSGLQNKAAEMRAPTGSAPTKDDRIAGTGTGEDHNAEPLIVGQMATLIVGEAAIRVEFGAAAETVATTSLRLPGGTRIDWLVTENDKTVSAEAGSGSGAWEAWVWTSSGARA